MVDLIRFPTQRIRFVSEDGFLTRDAVYFLTGLFNRVGGATAPSVTDVSESIAEDASVSEVRAAMYEMQDDFGQSPPNPELLELQREVDGLMMTQVSLLAEIAELNKTVEGLMQGQFVNNS